MNIELPLLLNILKDLIDIDFNDELESSAKENELKVKLRKNELKIKSRILELGNERDELMNKIDDIESAIINMESLMEWSKS